MLENKIDLNTDADFLEVRKYSLLKLLPISNPSRNFNVSELGIPCIQDYELYFRARQGMLCLYGFLKCNIT